MTPLDVFEYLPTSRIVEFPKNGVVYGPSRACDHLYLVLSGRVKIYRTADDGSQTLLRVACPEQLFGEASLLGENAITESACVMEDARLMLWTPSEILHHIERLPLLGIALAQHCANLNLLLQARLVGMALYKTETRVVMSLIQLVEALGNPNSDGSFRIRGMTHQSVADYVGTSREIVTSQMNLLRRRGCIVYSRRYIDVRLDALNQILQKQSLKAATAYHVG